MAGLIITIMLVLWACSLALFLVHLERKVSFVFAGLSYILVTVVAVLASLSNSMGFADNIILLSCVITLVCTSTEFSMSNTIRRQVANTNIVLFWVVKILLSAVLHSFNV